jgi:hypothetical protein
MSLSLTLEFSGGAELLVDKQKKHEVTLPPSSATWNLQVGFKAGSFTIQIAYVLFQGILSYNF